MLKKIISLAILATCVMAAGCSSAHRTKNTQQKAEPQRMVGNDRDSHGCLPSAGYQWSELLKDCIRPFEKGVRLDPVAGNPSNGMTCLVFNADSSKVEVFLPSQTAHPILERQPQGDRWASPSEPELLVSNEGKVWTAALDGKVMYRSK